MKTLLFALLAVALHAAPPIEPYDYPAIRVWFRYHMDHGGIRGDVVAPPYAPDDIFLFDTAAPTVGDLVVFKDAGKMHCRIVEALGADTFTAGGVYQRAALWGTVRRVMREERPEPPEIISIEIVKEDA